MALFPRRTFSHHHLSTSAVARRYLKNQDNIKIEDVNRSAEPILADASSPSIRKRLADGTLFALGWIGDNCFLNDDDIEILIQGYKAIEIAEHDDAYQKYS